MILIYVFNHDVITIFFNHDVIATYFFNYDVIAIYTCFRDVVHAENRLLKAKNAATNLEKEFQGVYKCYPFSYIYSLTKFKDRSMQLSLDKTQSLRQERGSGVKKTSLAYIKVQPVMDLLLFTESQNLRL